MWLQRHITCNALTYHCARRTNCPSGSWRSIVALGTKQKIITAGIHTPSRVHYGSTLVVARITRVVLQCSWPLLTFSPCCPFCPSPPGAPVGPFGQRGGEGRGGEGRGGERGGGVRWEEGRREEDQHKGFWYSSFNILVVQYLRETQVGPGGQGCPEGQDFLGLHLHHLLHHHPETHFPHELASHPSSPPLSPVVQEGLQVHFVQGNRFVPRGEGGGG